MKNKRGVTEGEVRMDYNDYLRKLIQSFLKNHTTRYMFIKHYNTLLISEEERYHIIMSEASELCLLFYEFPMHNMQGPYAPFLEWIRELYYNYFKNVETPEEFVEHGGVYSLHQEMFASYIRNGVGKRTEDILIADLAYERERMLKSLINLYVYISKHKSIFIFLEKFHLANASCIQFVCQLLERQDVENIQLLAMYNEVYCPLEYVTNQWKKLTQLIELQNLQYEWSGVSTESTVDVQNEFLPRKSQMNVYLEDCVNMYFFLCLEDAKYYMNMIYDRIVKDITGISEQQCKKFYEVFSLVLLMNGEYARALQMCQEVGRIGRKNNDDLTMYRYYYLYVMCQFGMEQVENKAKVYIDHCQEIARKQGDELAEYKAEVLRVLSEHNYWRGVFETSYHYQVSDKFVRDTEKFGFRNILAHLYIFCMDNEKESILAVIRGEKKTENFDRGIAIATELDNVHLLMDAYTRYIVLFSEYGSYSNMEIIYKRKLELVKKENNLVRKVHTYNGLGYLSGVMEKYQQAEEYFGTSLLNALDLKDGNEVAITLFNSAVNKMLAREFEQAAEDLDLVVQIMDVLNMHFITICDTSRIYGLLGFCSFYMGEEYKCYLCLDRIETYTQHLQYVEDEDKYKNWHATLFLYHMIRAMIYVSGSRFLEAKEEFGKADYHQKQDLGDMYFSYPLYVVEMAKYYERQNMEAEWANVLEEGIEFCNQNGYHLKSAYLLQMLQKKVDRSKHQYFSKRSISNDKLLERIENMAVQKRAELNKRNVDFMVIWQEILNKGLSSEEMVSQTITMMKNYFNLDGVIMIKDNKREVYIDYFDGPEECGNDTCVTSQIRSFTTLELEKIMDYFRAHKCALLTNRLDKGFLEYRELLECFDMHHIVTFFASPKITEEGNVTDVMIGYMEMRDNTIGNRDILQEQDFTILKFFSSQLYVSLERLQYLELIKRMNSQLSDMAVTDLLTGLYNRQGFEKRIQEDQGKDDVENIILYIDLDNFKYYNDTFGHELGDFVLLRFAQLLERVVDGSNGYAVRYGGDEFVIVINDRDIEYGKKIAKNIFYMIADGLNNAIARKIGLDVIVPKDKLLSCSIGIASYVGYDKDKVREALDKADKGLYYVKRSTKNNYVVWDELKNQT